MRRHGASTRGKSTRETEAGGESEINVGENKVGGLNMVNSDVGSDDINQTVDTREIISRVKPDLLIRLKSVAAGAA